jgi:hypothetical protein
MARAQEMASVKQIPLSLSTYKLIEEEKIIIQGSNRSQSPSSVVLKENHHAVNYSECK